MYDLRRTHVSDATDLTYSACSLTAEEKRLARIDVLMHFVAMEQDLPGCCFIELMLSDQSITVAVDARGNLIHLIVGCPGQIWITLDRATGNVTSMLASPTGRSTIASATAAKHDQERVIDTLIETIRESGIFVGVMQR